jgi:DNA-binding MarR family transcriptional regulator
MGGKAASSRQAGRNRQAAVSGRLAGEKIAFDTTPLALDRLIHERLRLGIVSALAANKQLTFNELKRLLQTTDGNLSVHARKLEEADYVACEKTFAGRVPRTVYRLTASGRRALDKYLAHMEAIIQAVKE